MKKFMMLVIIVAFSMFLGSAAFATTLTIPQGTLLDTTNFVDLDAPPPYTANSGTEHSRGPINVLGFGPGARYEISLQVNPSPPPGSPNWSEIQIGDGFDHPNDNSGMVIGGGPFGGDFSAFSDYKLAIHNPNASLWFMANIYVNDGWTDFGEPDTYYEDTWTWIGPGTTTVFTLDLTSLSLPNHGSNIGFKVGANLTGDESWNPAMAANVQFDVDVAAPIPGTAVLLISMLAGALGIRRVRRM